MPLIQKSNQKITPDFIDSMKTQSLTQKNDKANWTSARTALASGIISSFGLAYLTYKHYGQKDIAPIASLSSPIGTALKVLLPLSIVIPAISYCFMNKNSQKSSPKFFTNPVYYSNAPQNKSHSSQYQYIDTNSNEDFQETTSQNSSSPYSSLSSFKVLEIVFETCFNFINKRELTEDTAETIKNVFIFLENKPVCSRREKIIDQLSKLVNVIMTVEKNHDLAASITSHAYHEFLKIAENRAVDIAFHCLNSKRFKDPAKNNDLMDKCEEIVEYTKKREKLFIPLAVKCSEIADSSAAHNDLVIEFLEKYKKNGAVIVNYMIGCSKQDNSYAQEKIKSLFIDQGSCLPFLNSCIDHLFVENKLEPLAGNKAVIFNFFDKRSHIYDWDLLPICQKIIESYKTAYQISETEKFIQMLVKATDIGATEKEEKQYNIDSADAYTLLKIIFKYYKLSKDYENMKMLHANCSGQSALFMLAVNIDVALDSFEPNLNQLEQRLLLTK